MIVERRKPRAVRTLLSARSMRLRILLVASALTAGCGGTTSSSEPGASVKDAGATEAGPLSLCAGWRFAPQTTVPSGHYPEGVTVGDFNDDGRADLAVVNGGDDDLGVLLGRGDGTFAAQVTTPVGTEPDAIAAADFDADGELDVAVVNGIVSGVVPTSGPTVGVLLNRGGGTFAAQVAYPAGASFYSQPQALAVGDLNGDGVPDIAVTTQGENTVSVLLNEGNGTFAAQVSYTAGMAPTKVALGDFDGKADLAVTNFALGYDDAPNTVSVLHNEGNGTFAKPAAYAADSDPQGTPLGVGVGDFDGDGKVDLAVSNYSDSSISVLLGHGDGTFASPTTYSTGDSPGSMAVADYNGDGKVDIAVVNGGDKTVSVLLGNGDGTFAAQTAFPSGKTPLAIAAGDFNGDGYADVAVANHDDDTVGVFLSTCE
jgi:hypothetical protein